MTRTVITVEEDASLGELAELMAKHNIKRIPVVRDNFVVGIVSRANLLQALLSRDPKDAGSHPDDADLRRAVVDAVGHQSWTSAWPTNVVVSNGVVHLWGFVQTETVRKAYRVVAENVPGVRIVKNHLRTIPMAVHLGV